MCVHSDDSARHRSLSERWQNFGVHRTGKAHSYKGNNTGKQKIPASPSKKQQHASKSLPASAISQGGRARMNLVDQAVRKLRRTKWTDTRRCERRGAEKKGRKETGRQRKTFEKQLKTSKETTGRDEIHNRERGKTTSRVRTSREEDDERQGTRKENQSERTMSVTMKNDHSTSQLSVQWASAPAVSGEVLAS